MLWRLTPSMVPEEIKKSGAHPGSWPIFRNKAEIVPLKLTKVRTPAANILKQEMLALGGDVITPLSTILGKEEYVNIILLGTRRQYERLVTKLELMNFFGLIQWRKEILKALDTSVKPVTVLRDGRTLDYGKTLIMGILNLTPDSFYANSRVSAADDIQLVVKTAGKLLAEGADILDFGAESTRPGAKEISDKTEIERLLPGLQAVRKTYPEAVISVDTYHPNTAQEALQNGADIINDVSGAESVAMRALAELYHAPWIITHNGNGGILEVTENLLQRADKLSLPKEKIILDPGIGFGKTSEDNLAIIKNLSVLMGYGYPVLLGTSRKSVIGTVLDLPPEERLEGTLATSVVGALQGANILRVHDVEPNRRAVKMAEALR